MGENQDSKSVQVQSRRMHHESKGIS